MIENNILFLNLEVKMECSLSFWHSFENKKSYIHPHKRDQVRISPNTTFSAIEFRIDVQSGENCLKMLSDQKQQKNSGHHRLKFWSFVDQMSFLWLVMLVYSSRSFKYEKNQHQNCMRYLHRKPCRGELVVSNLLVPKVAEFGIYYTKRGKWGKGVINFILF